MNQDFIYNKDFLSELDETARKLSETGDYDNWFFYFRMAITGFRNRIFGSNIHYNNILSCEMHTDYDFASLFFNMDSAIECFVFALICLGNRLDKEKFYSIRLKSELNGIYPSNIINDIKGGYEAFFPLVKKEFIKEKWLVDFIIDTHVVSKHRYANFNDYDINKGEKIVYLRKEPKKHLEDQSGETEKLDNIYHLFCAFTGRIVNLAYLDTRTINPSISSSPPPQ